MEGHFTRRSFLVGTLSVAAVAVTPVVLAAPAAALSTPKAATLQRSTFTPAIGHTFRMTAGATSISVVLRQITDLLAAAPGSEDQFSLLFSAPQKVPQGTYTLSNGTVGTVNLLVVPVDRGSQAQRYQAIINRR